MNDNEFLQHYGVLGMKWGRRKGSSSGSTGNREAKRAAREEKKRQAILKSPRKLYKNRDKFSQEEIDKAMKRMKWERELRNLTKDELTSGAQYADAILKYVGTATAVYNVSKPVIKQVKKMW